jgi:hypothetical protein
MISACYQQGSFSNDKWFSANKLSLNIEKTNVINITKYLQYPLNIGYSNKYIKEGLNTKFLGLQIDNYLNWKTILIS